MIKIMKIKRFSFMLVLILFVFLTSCAPNSSSSSSQELAGFKGLEMELKISNTDFLVSESSKDFEIPFNVIIKNHGTFTVPGSEAVLQISGYDPSLFSTTKSKIVKVIKENIEGKSTTRPTGDIIVLPSSELGLKLDPNGIKSIKEKYEFDLFYNLCYKYSTSLSSSIKLNPLNTLDLANQVSNQNSISFSRGQGAPLAVTRIDVFSTNDKVLLTVYVEKKSGKLIYYPDTFSTSECGTIDFSSRNKFKVKEVYLSGKKAEDCGVRDNEFYYLDESGRGQITCTFKLDEPMTAPITSILSLDLEYYVFDSISQRFTIRKI